MTGSARATTERPRRRACACGNGGRRVRSAGSSTMTGRTLGEPPDRTQRLKCESLKRQWPAREDADAGRPAPGSAARSTARAAWERWTGHAARRDDEVVPMALDDAVDA